MLSHKKLLIIDTICLCIILWALAVKVSQSLPQPAKLFPPIPEPSQRPVVSDNNEPFISNTSDINKSSPAIGPAEVPPVKLPPTITALSYLVGNVVTGDVYLERNGNTALPVASMSKLVTAIAATDMLKATTTILITPEEADVPPDGSGLVAGERFTVGELMYPLLLDSSNIAAEALASSSDRANFINQMNGYSWEIGMPHTYFADPTGISPHNQATAEDFFALAKYLYNFRPDILALTRTIGTTTATTTDHGAHIFDSIHPFVTDQRFIGGKTGHTPEAGDTMLTILWIKGKPVAFIVIGSGNGERAQDTQMLIEKASAVI